jgi:hypothetical protein
VAGSGVDSGVCRMRQGASSNGISVVSPPGHAVSSHQHCTAPLGLQPGRQGHVCW